MSFRIQQDVTDWDAERSVSPALSVTSSLQSSDTEEKPTGRRKYSYKKRTKACVYCSRRKVACTGTQPCERCYKRGQVCEYSDQPQPKRGNRPRSVSPSNGMSPLAKSATTLNPDGTVTERRLGGGPSRGNSVSPRPNSRRRAAAKAATTIAQQASDDSMSPSLSPPAPLVAPRPVLNSIRGLEGLDLGRTLSPAVPFLQTGTINSLGPWGQDAMSEAMDDITLSQYLNQAPKQILADISDSAVGVGSLLPGTVGFNLVQQTLINQLVSNSLQLNQVNLGTPIMKPMTPQPFGTSTEEDLNIAVPSFATSLPEEFALPPNFSTSIADLMDDDELARAEAVSSLGIDPNSLLGNLEDHVSPPPLQTASPASAVSVKEEAVVPHTAFETAPPVSKRSRRASIPWFPHASSLTIPQNVPDLPSPEAIGDLLQNYLIYIYPIEPILHGPTFYKYVYHTKTPLLLYACCALAAPYSQHYEVLQNPKEVAEGFAQRALSILIDLKKEDDGIYNLETLQGLCALTIYVNYTGRGKVAYRLMSLALSIARNLKIAEDGTLPRPKDYKEFLEREYRSRAMWACWVKDRFMAYVTEGEAITSVPEFSTLTLPCPESIWEAPEPSTQAEFEALMSKWEPIQGKYLDWMDLPRGSEMRRLYLEATFGNILNIGSWASVVNLANLMGRVQNFRHFCRKHSLAIVDLPDTEEGLQAQRLRKDLVEAMDDCYAVLPEKVKELTAAGQATALFRLASMTWGEHHAFKFPVFMAMYHMLRTLLCSPERWVNPFKDTTAWFSTPLFFEAEQHAITITRLFEDLRRSNPSMNWFSPWTIGSVIRAGYIHFVALRRIQLLSQAREEQGLNSGNDETLLSLEKEITSCLQACEAMAKRWPHVERAYDIFKRLVVDYVAPTAEEVAQVSNRPELSELETKVGHLDFADAMDSAADSIPMSALMETFAQGILDNIPGDD